MLRKLFVYDLVIIKDNPCTMYIMIALKWSENIVHIGNHLKYDLSDDTHVNKKKGHFISSVNRLVAKCGFVQSDVLNKLFLITVVLFMVVRPGIFVVLKQL